MNRLPWMIRGCLLVMIGAVLLGTGCEDDSGGADHSGHDFGDNDPNLVVALGDSITAGFGLSGSESYPAQLAGMTGRPVVNSGSNGERSGGGLSRVGGVLSRHKPGFLLILYGSNDVIGGVATQTIVENLRGIIQAAKANQTIPIIGTVPPAFDSHAFMSGGIEALNPQISQMAKEEGAAVAGVNGALKDRGLFQADGLHPTAEGEGRIASAFAGKL